MKIVHPGLALSFLVIFALTSVAAAGADGGGQSNYSTLEVHLGHENEASARRINFPLHIQLSSDWKTYNEQFRQLGVLVDLWDQAQRGEILLEETRNVPLPGVNSSSVFRRTIRIVRTNWDKVGEKCGYRSNGSPHSGCAFNKRLPKCTIYVPFQKIYANGDINEYHNLLGHEMWHCLAGSFH